MKIDQETLAVLARCTIGQNRVVLPPGQLDRALYARVDKVLKAAGGKWNRGTKSHHFIDDATEVIEQAILTGEIRREKQELGIFYTPQILAERAADEALIMPGMTVLEPSAGMGALARVARVLGGQVSCIDIHSRHVDQLTDLGFFAMLGDFINVAPTSMMLFDRVLMNPPFAKQADAQHFLHAVGFVNPGGRLVSIMSAAVTFRQTAAYQAVRDLVEQGGTIQPLPANSFKSSGTSVNAVLVTYNKPTS